MALAIACVSCGRFLAAIPRYTEINQPVTNQEITGEWLLTTNSLDYPRADGFQIKGHENFSITIRSNGSCSYHSIVRDENGRTYKELDGRWSLSHNPTNIFRNELYLVLMDKVESGQTLRVAIDKNEPKEMVLWESWGDPDAGIDLVYRKKPQQH